jgi:L-rhamnose mutarotase
MRKLFFLIIPFLFLAYCSEPESAKEIGQVQRYAWVIKVKPEKLEEYKELHANPWPGINKMIKDCYIGNYSIYYRDGYLFSYLEYTGDDWDADMKKMAADSLTKEWWKLTDPCQEPVESAREGEWWVNMEEVYHLEEN